MHIYIHMYVIYTLTKYSLSLSLSPSPSWRVSVTYTLWYLVAFSWGKGCHHVEPMVYNVMICNGLPENKVLLDSLDYDYFRHWYSHLGGILYTAFADTYGFWASDDVHFYKCVNIVTGMSQDQRLHVHGPKTIRCWQTHHGWTVSHANSIHLHHVSPCFLHFPSQMGVS